MTEVAVIRIAEKAASHSNSGPVGTEWSTWIRCMAEAGVSAGIALAELISLPKAQEGLYQAVLASSANATVSTQRLKASKTRPNTGKLEEFRNIGAVYHADAGHYGPFPQRLRMRRLTAGNVSTAAPHLSETSSEQFRDRQLRFAGFNLQCDFGSVSQGVVYHAVLHSAKHGFTLLRREGDR